MSETVRILDKTATLFKDGDKPIYLLPDGRFAVETAAGWIVKKTLAAVEKAAITERPSLRIFIARGYSAQSAANFEPITAVAFERMILDAAGKKHHKGWGQWYVYDEETVKKLQDLERRRARFEVEVMEEFHRITKGAKVVSESNFKALVAASK